MEGWIKIQRQILDWEWWGDPIMVKVWLQLLFDANYEQKNWKGVTIGRGQLVFGRAEYAKKCSISEQQMRTVISRLKSTGEITTQSTNRFTLVTISKYDYYNQTDETSTSQTTSQRTNKQPTSNQQSTTPKELKKERSKEEYTSAFSRFWDAYPRKVDKARAVKAWMSMVKAGSNPESIISGAERYAKQKAGTDPQYIKHPATFLNAGSWDNEEETKPDARGEINYGAI